MVILLMVFFWVAGVHAQIRFEGSFDIVPRPIAPGSDQVDRSLQFRPAFGIGLGGGVEPIRLGFILKGGAAFVGVGTNSSDFSLLKGIRAGTEFYLKLINLGFSMHDTGEVLMALEQNYHIYRGQENYWETTVRAGIGGKMVWDNQDLPIFMEGGLKVMFSHFAGFVARSVGVFAQFTIF